MKLKTVTYSVSIDIYDRYNDSDTRRDKIELTAELDDDDNCEDAAAMLRATCIQCLGETTKQKEECRRELEEAIGRLLFGLKEAKKEWDEAQRFLVAQGLRENVPDFPLSKKLIKKLQEADSEF